MGMEEGDHRLECCRNPENLELCEDTNLTSGNMKVYRCKVSGHRHWVFEPKPIEIKVSRGM